MDTLACGFAESGQAGFYFAQLFVLAMATKQPNKFILATKVGMTQMYSEKGELVGVTLLHAAPNVVTQIKTKEKDGYTAVQISAGSKKAKNLGKGLRGHFKDLGSFRWSREFHAAAVGGKDLAVGDNVDVSIFAPGDVVRISGLTKGKGFAGAVKRHGFHGSPASHGHHHVLRHVGSIGQRFPQHTLKGTRGAGRDGQERISVRGLRVMAVDLAEGIVAVKGAVPGANGAVLEVIS
jgi:large subunit ribosomal protein L3